jgi:hypothetical protein
MREVWGGIKRGDKFPLLTPKRRGRSPKSVAGPALNDTCNVSSERMKQRVTNPETVKR